jgi:hypothetical protein
MGYKVKSHRYQFYYSTVQQNGENRTEITLDNGGYLDLAPLTKSKTSAGKLPEP